MTDKWLNIIQLKQMIVDACIASGLNICVSDGKIGFVDQEERKIIAVWDPQYMLSEAAAQEGEAKE
jgi:hypothetical protein